MMHFSALNASCQHRWVDQNPSVGQIMHCGVPRAKTFRHVEWPLSLQRKSGTTAAKMQNFALNVLSFGRMDGCRLHEGEILHYGVHILSTFDYVDLIRCFLRGRFAISGGIHHLHSTPQL